MECPFCINAKYNDITTFKSKIIFEGKYFYVIPDLHPVSKSHVLIISKSHYLGLANVPNYQLDEFSIIIKGLIACHMDYYNKQPFFFEHGSISQQGDAGNSIFHMHYHSLTLGNIEKVESQICNILQREPIIIDNYSNIKQITNKDYLLIEQGYKKLFVINKNKLESQFLRKIIYELNSNITYGYDWKRNSSFDIYKKTSANTYMIYSSLQTKICDISINEEYKNERVRIL